MRASGILLPVTSLPSRYGIGSFSREAYKFVDFLKASGQTYWQMLPLGPTGYGDSPYQSFSTFAGNPYLIDLEALVKEGWLTKAECEAYDFGDNPQYVDYEKMYFSRFPILRTAYERSDIRDDTKYQAYCQDQAAWLDDYCLYMAVKNSFGGASWSEWDEDIRYRQEEALQRYKKTYEDDIEFYRFLQYLFWSQWQKLKEYANKKGIRIIGDLPIYVAFDSADSWANPRLFQFDEREQPIAVAGCPPDGFSATGQLWGNPLYDWDYHRETGFEWWLMRISHCFKLYDMVRIDHFRGFDEYYSIPFGEKTAVNGRWMPGPGIAVFQTLQEKLGDLDIIAEDLGYLTDSVRKLLKDTGYPGMKVLEFAFDSREESDYLPHNYDRNCVVYTGTHDNDTLASWYQEISREDRDFSIRYLNNGNHDPEEIPWDFIRLAMESVAKLCIIPIQDYLGLGNEARINLPSTLGENWKWRLLPNQLSQELAEEIRDLTEIYGRLNGGTSNH